MTTAERADLTRRLDDLDARMTTIEADHADLTRRLATVPTRCRAHLAYARALPCAQHDTNQLAATSRTDDLVKPSQSPERADRLARRPPTRLRSARLLAAGAAMTAPRPPMVATHPAVVGPARSGHTVHRSLQTQKKSPPTIVRSNRSARFWECPARGADGGWGITAVYASNNRLLGPHMFGQIGVNHAVEKGPPEMTTTASCRKCGTTLPEPSLGRPRTYCGVGCRRAAEREVRRLDTSIAALEGRQTSHRESVAFGNGRSEYHEAKIAHLRAEIATAEARMRELLNTQEDHNE